MEIRKMTGEDDRLAVSRIYEESWRFAYKNLLPQAYLDSIPSGRWAKSLDTEGWHSLIMLENGQLIGTASYSKSRFEEFADFGEIISIYLLPGYIGKGLGRELLYSVVCALKAEGYLKIFLWVLEGNDRAIHVYEKFGFRPSGCFRTDEIGGKIVRELQYCLYNV